MNQPVVVGGTYDWFLNPALINSEAAPDVFAPWDLTGATVSISFINPSGVRVGTFSATAVDAVNGKYKYINTTSLFTVSGTWLYSWKVVLGGITLESVLIPVVVNQSGAMT
jgi:hypothetical protein